MQVSIKHNAEQTVLKVSGSLTFVDNKDWRNVAEEALSIDTPEHVLDLTELDSMDSAGLGMVLAIKKWSQDMDRTLKLHFNPDSAAGSVLRLSKFDDMFETISD